jgi:hypothetical protein
MTGSCRFAYRFGVVRRKPAGLIPRLQVWVQETLLFAHAHSFSCAMRAVQETDIGRL